MHHTVAVRRRPVPRPVALVAALALAAAVAACSHDGRTLAPIRPGQTTTTTTAASLDSASSVPATFSLTAEGADDGGELPAAHTCFGDGTSPALHWANVPADAQQLALVVRDRDADGFVHWLVTGIDPTAAGFPQGGVPASAVEQVNTTGSIGWEAPCPPAGGGRHVYDVVLHVLTQPVDIDPGLPAEDAATLVEKASSAQAHLAFTVTPPSGAVGTSR
jgi:Raf kinase inhibitor-like YbhB/YbcL family protein